MDGEKKCGCGLTWNTIHRFDGPCYVLDKPMTDPRATCEFISMQTRCPQCQKQHVWIVDQSAKPYDGFNPNPEGDKSSDPTAKAKEKL